MKLANITDQSVLKHTKKNWAQWILILEKAGARFWTHQETVKFLRKRYKLSSWWEQWVTIGFELHAGLRKEGQNLKGQYTLTVTKTINLDRKALWQFLSSPEGQQIWLSPMSDFSLEKGASFEIEGGIFGEVRTLKKPERVRLSWQEIEWEKPTVLQVYLVAKPNGRSLLVFSHEAIASARLKTDLRARWRLAADQIAAAACDLQCF